MTPVIPETADLAILGGGINGAGLARVATAEGRSVVLFEKDDYASGTSGRSTKLIHGGLRYLEHGHVGLVYESLRERGALVLGVPHLVKPLAFLLPSYQGDPRPTWKLRAGLALYDVLAGSRSIGRHAWLSARAARALAPGLRASGLAGAGLYFDAQVNDARLVLEDILWASSHGATCVNHCPVNAVAVRSSRRVELEYHHLPSGTSGRTTVRCLVVAAGPWTDRVQKDLMGRETRWLRPTRGTHIVVPEILGSHAVFGASPVDGRMFFVIPWRGYSLVGTTDIDDAGDPDHTAPTLAEMDYLLDGVAHYFPAVGLSRDSIVSAFAGLRPLVRAQASYASSVSREDRIVREGPVVSVLGGKLTTYRAMANKTWSRTRELLPPPERPRLTDGAWPATQPTAGFSAARAAANWSSALSLPLALCESLASFYGESAVEVLKLARDDPTLKEPLGEGCPEVGAQVAHAVLREHAQHLDDVLLRRITVGMGRHRVGPAVNRAAEIMARLMGWDAARQAEELARYRVALYPRVPLDSTART